MATEYAPQGDLMLDDMDIQYRVLEFEYKDYLSRREVTHYAEWGVPLGFFTALIASGRIQDAGSFVLVGFVALLLYIAINGNRKKQDLNLEAIRILLTDLARREPLPQVLMESPTITESLTLKQRISLMTFLVAVGAIVYLFRNVNPTGTGFLESMLGLSLFALCMNYLERFRPSQRRWGRRKRHKRTSGNKRR